VEAPRPPPAEDPVVPGNLNLVGGIAEHLNGFNGTYGRRGGDRKLTYHPEVL
jgi:hypothetical protein